MKSKFGGPVISPKIEKRWPKKILREGPRNFSELPKFFFHMSSKSKLPKILGGATRAQKINFEQKKEVTKNFGGGPLHTHSSVPVYHVICKPCKQHMRRFRICMK